MNTQIRATIRIAFCVCFAAALASCGGGGTLPTRSGGSQLLSSGRAPTYRLVVLGNGLVPNKINDAGTIVGQDLITNRPFEYRNGQVTHLPLWPGDTSGNAFDINDRGQIVGQTINIETVGPYLNSDNPCFLATCPQAHAVLYDLGQIHNLGATSPQAVFNSADVLNDNGVIAGESGVVREGGLINSVIFSPGPIRQLPNAQLPGAIDEGPGGPIEVNNGGEIVGAGQSIFFEVLLAYPNPIVCSPPLIALHNGFDGINNAGDTISGNFASEGVDFVFCQHGIGHQLRLLPAALNDRGDIVGSATAQDEVFSRGTFYKISGTTTGQSSTSPSNAISGTKLGRYFVSRDRAVEGYTQSVSPGDALLYSNGTYYDLNDLVPNHPELILQNPKSINNKGQIVGSTVTSSSQTVGWLLVPQ